MRVALPAWTGTAMLGRSSSDDECLRYSATRLWKERSTKDEFVKCAAPAMPRSGLRRPAVEEQ
jgi:hypothetical protein